MRFVWGLGTVIGFVCLWVAPASAGGWANSTLDEVPADPAPGEVVEIGWTVLQHGVTPAADLETAIVIDSVRFEGRPEGPPGHYVAEVRFPEAGTWEWEIDQGVFGTHSLGTLTIAEPDAGSGGGVSALQVGVPIGAGAAALVAVGLLVAGRRRGVSAASG